ELSDQLAQLTFTVCSRSLRRRRFPNESADSAPSFQNSVALQLGVDPGHRVGVHGEVHRELPNSGQLRPLLELPRRDCCPYSSFELGIDRSRAPEIQVELGNCPFVLSNKDNTGAGG